MGFLGTPTTVVKIGAWEARVVSRRLTPCRKMFLWVKVANKKGEYNDMQATKYHDLVVLLFLLDEAESLAGSLSKRFPELEALTEAVSHAANLCGLAITAEDMEWIESSPP